MQNNKSKQKQAEKETPTNWQRIEMVIQQSKMTANAFARHIGLPRGENLYQIKKGNNGISLDVATRICQHYPEIDKLWLLTGDGRARRAVGEYRNAEQRGIYRLCGGADTPGVSE